MDLVHQVPRVPQTLRLLLLLVLVNLVCSFFLRTCFFFLFSPPSFKCRYVNHILFIPDGFNSHYGYHFSCLSKVSFFPTTVRRCIISDITFRFPWFDCFSKPNAYCYHSSFSRTSVIHAFFLTYTVCRYPCKKCVCNTHSVTFKFWLHVQFSTSIKHTFWHSNGVIQVYFDHSRPRIYTCIFPLESRYFEHFVDHLKLCNCIHNARCCRGRPCLKETST